MSEMIVEFFCVGRGENRRPGTLKHCTEKSKKEQLGHLCYFQGIYSLFHSTLKAIYHYKCVDFKNK